MCKKINTCFKIRMILDKDMLEFQYKEAIESICKICTGKN
jgi:hypothetical protein